LEEAGHRMFHTQWTPLAIGPRAAAAPRRSEPKRAAPSPSRDKPAFARRLGRGHLQSCSRATQQGRGCHEVPRRPASFEPTSVRCGTGTAAGRQCGAAAAARPRMGGPTTSGRCACGNIELKSLISEPGRAREAIGEEPVAERAISACPAWRPLNAPSAARPRIRARLEQLVRPAGGPKTDR
jgi:hypothetical protein